jgi:pilus assembly protein CpaB
MQRKWALVIAIVLGFLAVFLTNTYFQQREAQLRIPEAKKTRVVVAAKDISKGATIGYEMLTFKEMPVNFIQPGALRAKESAVGKVALATIMAGEQILTTKLAHPGAGLTLAGKTPPGKRAFTVGLSTASAVGGMVRPGDHVDVLAIFSAPAVTLTLFQDVLVLAVGREMVPEEEEETRERRGAGSATSSRAQESITLALTPQQVQIVTVAMEHGQIRLTLRPQMEKVGTLPEVDLSQLPSVVDLNTLLQLYIGRQQKPVPSVEVIRGLKKETTSLPEK